MTVYRRQRFSRIISSETQTFSQSPDQSPKHLIEYKQWTSLTIGRIFGTINIIDALVVLFMLLIVVASTMFVLDIDGNSEGVTGSTHSITLEIPGLEPYVADAIPLGSVKSDAIVAVQNKSVRPMELVVQEENGQLYERTHPHKKTVVLQVVLRTTKQNDEVLFKNEALEIGQELTLNFGPSL